MGMFTNEATNKGLTSKIYKQLMQLNSNKTNSTMKKWAKSKQTFLQRRHTECQQTQKKLPNIMNGIIREMQTQTTMR